MTEVPDYPCPLAKIEGDEIVIRLPIAAISFAAKIAFEEGNYDVDDDTGEARMVVTDPAAFAIGLLYELNREGEDGSTPLHYLLDKAIIDAAEQGTEGLAEHDIQKETPA